MRRTLFYRSAWALDFDEDVRKRVLTGIERIVKAEAAASGAPQPPEITPLDRYPLVVNDPAASKRVVDAFRRHFSADRVCETGPAPASEDFGSFGAEWHAPSVFWFVGGTDPDRYAKAKEEAGSTRSRPITVRALPQLSIRPCRPASRRCSSRRALGWRHRGCLAAYQGVPL